MTYAPVSHSQSVGSTAPSNTQFMSALWDLFNSDATLWQVDAADASPGGGFIVSPTAGGDSQQVAFWVSGLSLYVGAAPEGGLSTPTAPDTDGATSFKDKLWDFDQDSGDLSELVDLHEWEDAFILLEINKDSGGDSVDTVVCAGVHFDPFLGDDISNGMTGHVLAVGAADVGAGPGDVFGAGGSGTTIGGWALAAPDIWAQCWFRDETPGDGTTDAWSIGGRTQPMPVPLYGHDIDPDDAGSYPEEMRPLGVMRHWLAYYENVEALRILETSGTTEEAAIVGESPSAGYRFAMPIETGFY